MMFITTLNENILNKSLWKSKMAAGSHLWKVPFFHYQASFIVHTNLAYLIQMFRPSWFHFWYLISILMSNVCWPLFSIKKKTKTHVQTSFADCMTRDYKNHNCKQEKKSYYELPRLPQAAILVRIEYQRVFWLPLMIGQIEAYIFLLMFLNP